MSNEISFANKPLTYKSLKKLEEAISIPAKEGEKHGIY